MEIRLQLREKDYVNLAYSQITRWQNPILVKVMMGIIVTAMLLQVFIHFKTYHEIQEWPIIIIIVGVLVFFITRETQKRIYRMNSFAQQEITYLFYDLGFDVITSTSNAFIGRNNIIKIKQSNKMIAFYINPALAYVIPKDLLNSQQLEFLDNWISA